MYPFAWFSLFMPLSTSCMLLCRFLLDVANKRKKDRKKVVSSYISNLQILSIKKKKKSVDLIKRGMKISNNFHAEGSVQKEKTLIALERLL